MRLYSHLPSWIGAKMTPVLQITDTDFAFIMKAAADRRKKDMAKDMRDRARLRGEIPDYKMGHEEIMEIVVAAHNKMVEDNAKNDTVVKAARRNGHLVWRPDWDEKKMVDCDLDERFKDAPLGSHRLRTDWLKGRKHWRDEEGKPWKADWARCERVQKMEDLAEADYCGKEAKDMQDHWVKIGGKEIKVHVTDATETTEGDGEDAPKVTWDQKMFTDAEAVEQLHPKIRRMIKAEMKSHSDNTKAKGQTKAQKKAEARRMMDALSKMDKEFEEWMAQMLLDHTKAEVSQMILAKANKKQGQRKGRAKAKANTTKKIALSKFIKATYRFFFNAC